MQTCWKYGNKLQVIKDRPYHYVECGLNNVYLYGSTQFLKERGLRHRGSQYHI
jgi:hypothetical protein